MQKKAQCFSSLAHIFLSHLKTIWWNMYIFVCLFSMWHEMHRTSARSHLRLNSPPPQLPSGPLLASKSWPTWLMYFIGCLSASPKRQWWILARDFCQFSVHISISQITSAQEGANANIPVHFSVPDSFHLPHYFPSWEHPILLCHALKTKAWGESWARATLHTTPLSYLWGMGRGSCSRGSSSCLDCPFVSLMTWLRKVFHEALRVILPDKGYFPHHYPEGKGDVSDGCLCWEAIGERSIKNIPAVYIITAFENCGCKETIIVVISMW